MTRLSITSALVIALATANQGWATTLPTPGPAPACWGIAFYYIETGEITVSVNGVRNWFIESQSFSLTGDPVENLPAANPPGIVSDNNQLVGELTAFYNMTYTDIALGAVAEPFLPEEGLSLTIDDCGENLWTLPVSYISIPEPATCGFALIATLCLTVGRRSTR